MYMCDLRDRQVSRCISTKVFDNNNSRRIQIHAFIVLIAKHEGVLIHDNIPYSVGWAIIRPLVGEGRAVWVISNRGLFGTGTWDDRETITERVR